MLFTLLLAALGAGLAACGEEAAECDHTGCDLRLSPGDGRRVIDDAELTVHDLMVREHTADSAVVAVNGDRRELTTGTTQQIGGLRVTLVSVDPNHAHLLVAPLGE